VELYLLCFLSAHDFNYPKILILAFEEEIMLFQTIQPVLGKSMYQNAFLAAENRLNIQNFVKYLVSNQIAIQIALNIQKKKVLMRRTISFQ